jgi:alpha 1,3-glucosidase
MVGIVDPHLKRDSNYPVFEKAKEMGILVKPKGGEGEYEGWCWPGSSSWVDFFNPASWDWWKSLFKPYQLEGGAWSWTQSTEDVHIWNDMNEVRGILPMDFCTKANNFGLPHVAFRLQWS